MNQETNGVSTMPYQAAGLTLEEVERLGIDEARAAIRRSGAHKTAGISGVDLVRLPLNACKAFLITGLSPVRERESLDPAAAAIQALQNALGSGDTAKAEMRAYIESEIDELRKDLRKDIETLAPRRIEIEVKTERGLGKIEGAQHKLFPAILKMLACPEVNTALVGPAASGKSKIGEVAAKVLGIPFYTWSANILSSKSDILGFTDANGRFVETAFYKAFTRGGLFVADEFDACHAGVATILNAAIANRLCTFASGEVTRAHENFRFICCMNTFGTGPSAQYVGRNRLDAATLDRFAFLYVDIDSNLERALLGLSSNYEEVDISRGGVPAPSEWLDTVLKYRKKAAAEKMQVMVSMRASIMGVALANQGFGRKMLTEMLILKGLNDADRNKLRGA